MESQSPKLELPILQEDLPEGRSFGIFQKKLEAPIGFYRERDKYYYLKKEYNHDKPKLDIINEMWSARQAYQLRKRFKWPPKLLNGTTLFWTSGYYEDFLKKSHAKKILGLDGEWKPMVVSKEPDPDSSDEDNEGFKLPGHKYEPPLTLKQLGWPNIFRKFLKWKKRRSSKKIELEEQYKDLINNANTLEEKVPPPSVVQHRMPNPSKPEPVKVDEDYGSLKSEDSSLQSLKSTESKGQRMEVPVITRKESGDSSQASETSINSFADTADERSTNNLQIPGNERQASPTPVINNYIIIKRSSSRKKKKKRSRKAKKSVFVNGNDKDTDAPKKSRKSKRKTGRSDVEPSENIQELCYKTFPHEKETSPTLSKAVSEVSTSSSILKYKKSKKNKSHAKEIKNADFDVESTNLLNIGPTELDRASIASKASRKHKKKSKKSKQAGSEPKETPVEPKEYKDKKSRKSNKMRIELPEVSEKRSKKASKESPTESSVGSEISISSKEYRKSKDPSSGGTKGEECCNMGYIDNLSLSEFINSDISVSDKQNRPKTQ